MLRYYRVQHRGKLFEWSHNCRCRRAMQCDIKEMSFRPSLPRFRKVCLRYNKFCDSRAELRPFQRFSATLPHTARLNSSLIGSDTTQRACKAYPVADLSPRVPRRHPRLRQLGRAGVLTTTAASFLGLRRIGRGWPPGSGSVVSLLYPLRHSSTLTHDRCL